MEQYLKLITEILTCIFLKNQIAIAGEDVELHFVTYTFESSIVM